MKVLISGYSQLKFNLSGKARGNAIVEYAMPGVLILAVCIGLLSAIGAGLNSKFGMLQKDMTARASAASSQEQQHKAKKDAFQAAMSQALKTGGASGSGSYDAKSVSPEELAKVIQTAGANGATESLADALKKYVEKMQAEGNLSEDQASMLSKLANAGHDLAQAEKALQDAVSNGQSTVNFNGKSYSVTDFSGQFGMANGISGVAPMDAANANPQMAPFLNLYNEAKSSGALSDPGVSSQVSYLSQQITALGELAKTNIAQGKSLQEQSYAYTTAATNTDFGMGLTPSQTGDIAGSTHANSGGICGVGNGSDSGTKCN